MCSEFDDLIYVDWLCFDWDFLYVCVFMMIWVGGVSIGFYVSMNIGCLVEDDL